MQNFISAQSSYLHNNENFKESMNGNFTKLVDLLLCSPSISVSLQKLYTAQLIISL